MTKLDLSSNYFDLFGLAIRFEIDEPQLAKQFRHLQQQLHPDRFVARPDAERRWSMQAASLVNQAHDTLRNDLSRATYLLEMNGINIDEETDTQMDPMFLMEQMELREALEIAEGASDPETALSKLRRQIKVSVVEQKDAFSKAMVSQDYASARVTTRQWQFLDKLLKEAKRIEERLDV